MQIPKGLMPPERASVVQKPVMIQQPLNSVDTSSRLQINPLPQQTTPTPVTTTFHSHTAVQSKPSVTTERSEELPGTVKLNQGVESLEPSGLASASNGFSRWYKILCVYGLLFLLDESLFVQLLSHGSSLGEVQRLLEANQCVLVDLRNDRTSGRIRGSINIPSTQETPQGVKMPFFLQSLVALCRFLGVEILWHFYTFLYISIRSVLYFVWRLWNVLRVHPMMCLGSTEGWRNMRRSGLDTLWWYCFASIAPTELLNMRILVLLKVVFSFSVRKYKRLRPSFFHFF